MTSRANLGPILMVAFRGKLQMYNGSEYIYYIKQIKGKELWQKVWQFDKIVR